MNDGGRTLRQLNAKPWTAKNHSLLCERLLAVWCLPLLGRYELVMACRCAPRPATAWGAGGLPFALRHA